MEVTSRPSGEGASPTPPQQEAEGGARNRPPSLAGCVRAVVTPAARSVDGREAIDLSVSDGPAFKRTEVEVSTHFYAKSEQIEAIEAWCETSSQHMPAMSTVMITGIRRLWLTTKH